MSAIDWKSKMNIMCMNSPMTPAKYVTQPSLTGFQAQCSMYIDKPSQVLLTHSGTYALDNANMLSVPVAKSFSTKMAAEQDAACRILQFFRVFSNEVDIQTGVRVADDSNSSKAKQVSNMTLQFLSSDFDFYVSVPSATLSDPIALTMQVVGGNAYTGSISSNQEAVIQNLLSRFSDEDLLRELLNRQ